MSSKKSDFSSAYKLTRRAVTSSARVKRRSIEWKNIRYEEAGKRRNLDKLSPLQESDQNLSNSRHHNYDGKTPSKKGNKEGSRMEMLLKWRNDRKRMKEEESKKNKPSFKVHHVQHIDTDLYNKPTTDASTKHNKATASNTWHVEPVPAARPSSTTRATRSTSSIKQITAASNKSQVAALKQVKSTTRRRTKPQSPPVTRRMTRQMTKVVDKKENVKPKLEKGKKPVEKSREPKKKSYNVDLRKVATKRGEIADDDAQSFAPNNFRFAAPSNLTSFTFKPLSPASASEFLCPNNETASTSFFSAEPAYGRCSTPGLRKSKRSKQPHQSESASSSASSDDGATTYSVVVDGKKINRSTRQSSLSNVDTDELSDDAKKSSQNVNGSSSESASSSASSDDGATTYSVVVDGKKINRSTRQSSLSNVDTDELSDDAKKSSQDVNGSSSDEAIERCSVKPTEYTVVVDGTPVKRGRKSLKSVKMTPTRSRRGSVVNHGNSELTPHGVTVFTPRRSTRKSLRPVTSDTDSALETVPLSVKIAVDNDPNVASTSRLSRSEFTEVKTPNCSRRKSLRRVDSSQGSAINSHNGNDLSKDGQIVPKDTQNSDNSTSSDSDKDIKDSKTTRSSRKARMSEILDKNDDEQSVDLPLISDTVHNSTSSDSEINNKNSKTRSRKNRKSQIVNKNNGEKLVDIAIASEGEVCSDAEKSSQSSKEASTHLLEAVDKSNSSDSETKRSSRKMRRSCVSAKNNNKEKPVTMLSDIPNTENLSSNNFKAVKNSASSDSDKDKNNLKTNKSRKSYDIEKSVAVTSDTNSSGDAEKSFPKDDGTSAYALIDEAADNSTSSESAIDKVYSHTKRSSRKSRKSQIDAKNGDEEKSLNVVTTALEMESIESKESAIAEEQSPDKKWNPVRPIMYTDIEEQNGSNDVTTVREEDTVNSKSEDTVFHGTPIKRSRRKSTSSVDQFQEPGEPMSTRKSTRKRRKTTACDIPPELRSPDQWIQVLESSPMVEMSRRTLKSKTPPEKAIPIEPLNFDDFDDEIPNVINPFSGMLMPTENAVPMDVDLKEAGPSEDIVTESSGEHNVKYFRNLLVTETARLQNYCATWDSMDHSNSGITEESEGQIRTVIGQAQLLIDQRFKQFRGLVDDCEFKRGEKETTCTDLQGFWDMIFFQVEDVDKKFEQLHKLKDKNWVVEKIVEKKKIVKKKPVATKTTKPAVSKFARFRAEIKKNKALNDGDNPDEKTADSFKVFDAGFFKVQSPVKSPAQHCRGPPGTSQQVPTKDTETFEVNSADTGTKEEHIDLPLSKTQLTKTPNRRSYAPSVPSPLLRDITPKHGSRKTLALGCLSVPRKLIEGQTEGKENTPAPEPQTTSILSSATKSAITPRRRSIRIRNLPTDDNASGRSTLFDGELRKYLEPSSVDTDSGASPVSSGRKRRSSLKIPPSSAKRRSRHRSVKFSDSSPLPEGQRVGLPCTPFNRDSLVARARVSKGDLLIDLPAETSDSEITGQSCEPSRMGRPSLLFTPDKRDVTVCSSKENLINFSPL
ncbi:microtubule-associated protein futsch-like [Gigantopelta aegis]|uniref:microtubule-associated protein futsch-like n=1 Tax=Gigantopelta aegis TaxID=1735272 RepID=UPI001B88A93C|nr:microtubule-associated protein futsch-like [Gigantopelta aegis]